MRIAIIGLGRMGRALADRLLDDSHEVSVWNRTPGRAAPMRRAIQGTGHRRAVPTFYLIDCRTHRRGRRVGSDGQLRRGGTMTAMCAKTEAGQ